MMKNFFKLGLLSLLLQLVVSCGRDAYLIEAESFNDLGGWVVDQQFMDEMGSPYLLAHGLGNPVTNAKTEVDLSSGEYRVWVRTKDWVAQWDAHGAPGKFQLLVNGVALDETFGTKFAQWSWQDGGVVSILQMRNTLELRDLTGFEGRVDAILFCKDLAFEPTNESEELKSFRRELLGTTNPVDKGEYDLVVVGGGIAGITTALQGARNGLKVAFVQDRPVVGGNNSSEVRVWLNGITNQEPFSKLGDITIELEQEKRAHYGASNSAEIYEDDKKLDLLKREKNITLYMNSRGNEVVMDGSRIEGVIAEDILSGERRLLRSKFVADCTGDASIGYLAGADYELNDSIMGRSNLWNVDVTDSKVDFPRCPWALDLSDKPFPGRGDRYGGAQPWAVAGYGALGAWFWESGFTRDPFKYDEWTRDWNFRAMYGAWDALKNVDSLYPNHKLNWAAYISGKRESRRLMGDLILSKDDFLNSVKYDDGLIPTGWDMDVHIPDPQYEDQFPGDSYTSHDKHENYPRPYFIPYRTLYSRNVDNLFMAGRNTSVTHEALGSARVMRTGGLMGEVIGYAAYICIHENCSPREVYSEHLSKLKEKFKGEN